MIITHGPACTDPGRLEHYDAIQPSGLGASVVRCVSCGAQRVYCQPGMIITPGTVAYARAWRFQPSKIAAQVPRSQWGDPDVNPCHPHADNIAPGSERDRIPANARQPWKDTP